MSGPGSPATPDEPRGDRHVESSPNMFLDAVTPEQTKRMPSLRSVSDPPNLNPNSTARGLLGRARHPNQSTPSVAGSISMDNSVMARARALHQERMQKGGMVNPSSSPLSSPSPTGPGDGFSGRLRMPAPMQRPGPGPHPKSAPMIPQPSLGQRRANKLGMGMKLPGMGGGSPSPGFKLSDITGEQSGDAKSNGAGQRSKMDDFKQYIDAEKGWITFDGAATIMRTGVSFANGQTFSISLDEVEKLDELGKGNYGTVYKVKHAKPPMPRFGPGLSATRLHKAHSDPSPTRSESNGAASGHGTTGKVMAMKEIRLELDDAKFTTILKELVILHECISPYIIDFYGAFFQEGAVYICIEYMDGGSIDKLYDGGISENVLRKITYATVMGLKTLKDDHNIIHRDVKPTNILVNTRGQVKICDFGVSGNLVASIAKTNIGCQSYMAPERISGGAMAQSGNADGTYSVQSDIWSLGLTVIECATGRYPYPPEVSSTIFSQLSAIVEGDPPDLPKEGYSDMARDFIRGCLHKIPMMRATYPALLNHPWLKPLSKPQTITEEVEDCEEADKIAEEVGRIRLSADDKEDAEVGDWVKSVLRRKEEDGDNHGPSRPALHTVPLDSMSPTASDGEEKS
ncbi:MAP kinase kinase PBS2 [Ophiocordyceps camponoti-floridani]|uniref:mitogen-activated protein kinase kinase n=1 Tax=Ophiocordyceps camponoti-floridani TaxID=2030778 RepID=A0A8H4QCU8_9HYPO|nr:MAP kinase kinase PBS2 [Ophiocordyceps camponoti-floridani]